MMKQIEYFLADPAGNITVFVLSETEREDYPRVARALLEVCPEAEQVAFIKSGGDLPSMEMCGLEFCGNASRSFAYYEAAKAGRSRQDLTVRVSGCRTPLRAWAHPAAGTAGIEMPLPEAEEELLVPLEPEDAALLGLEGPSVLPSTGTTEATGSAGTVRASAAAGTDGASLAQDGRTGLRGRLIHMEGISHLVLQAYPQIEDQARIRALFLRIRDRVRRSSDRDMPAFGVMFLDRKTCRMLPVVYVRDVDTIYFEGSCASGTAAAGYALAMEEPDGRQPVEVRDPEEADAGAGTGRCRYVLQQPAGDLELITEEDDGEIHRLFLQGSVGLSEPRMLELEWSMDQ